jgi:hypothetical protein
MQFCGSIITDLSIRLNDTHVQLLAVFHTQVSVNLLTSILGNWVEQRQWILRWLSSFCFIAAVIINFQFSLAIHITQSLHGTFWKQLKHLASLNAIPVDICLSVVPLASLDNEELVLYLQVVGRFNRARASKLTLPHFVVQTPMFMPVGTQG